MTNRKNILLTALLFVALLGVADRGAGLEPSGGMQQDANSGQYVSKIELTGHTGQVMSIAFSPDGKKVITGSADDTARMWDAESGKELAMFKEEHLTYPVRSVAFSPNGKKVVTGASNYAVRIRDAKTGKVLQMLELPRSPNVTSVAFSPDGKKVVAGGNCGIAMIWDAESGKELQKLQCEDEDSTARGYWSSVAFLPDGRKVLVGSGKFAQIFDAESGKELQKFEVDTTAHKADYVDVTVGSAAFSPDGKKVALWCLEEVRMSYENRDVREDVTVRIFDAHSGKELHKLRAGTAVFGVTFSPDSKKLATCGSDKTAIIWDVESGKELQRLEGHTDAVMSVVFSSDGKKVATSSADKTARIWVLDSKNGGDNPPPEPPKECTCDPKPCCECTCTCGNWTGRKCDKTDSPETGCPKCHSTDTPEPAKECTCDPKPCCECTCTCGNWTGRKCDKTDSPTTGCPKCHSSPTPPPPENPPPKPPQPPEPPKECTCYPKPCCSCKCHCGNWTGQKCDGKPTSCICHRTTPPPLPVPSDTLEGIWQQLVDDAAIHDYEVKLDKQTRRYEMLHIADHAKTGLRTIYDVKYDGKTWSFDCETGTTVLKFVLTKVDNNTFEGGVAGKQKSKWVRQSPDEQKLYKDAKYGYSFRYPADWTQRTIEGLEVYFVGQPDAGFTPSVGIGVEAPNEDLLTLTKQDYQEALGAAYRKLTIKEFRVRKISGMDCLFIHFQGTRVGQDIPIDQYMLSFLYKDKTFTVTLADGSENFGKRRAVYDSILESLRFDAVPAAPQVEQVRFGVQAADNDGNGVIVEQVFEGYAGHKAGLRRGDVILAINGKKVATEKEYSDAVDASGKTMLLMVRKAGAGNIVTIAVELPTKQ